MGLPYPQVSFDQKFCLMLPVTSVSFLMADGAQKRNHRSLGSLECKPLFQSMILRVDFLRLCGLAAVEGSVLEASVC